MAAGAAFVLSVLVGLVSRNPFGSRSSAGPAPRHRLRRARCGAAVRVHEIPVGADGRPAGGGPRRGRRPASAVDITLPEESPAGAAAAAGAADARDRGRSGRSSPGRRATAAEEPVIPHLDEAREEAAGRRFRRGAAPPGARPGCRLCSRLAETRTPPPREWKRRRASEKRRRSSQPAPAEPAPSGELGDAGLDSLPGYLDPRHAVRRAGERIRRPRRADGRRRTTARRTRCGEAERPGSGDPGAGHSNGAEKRRKRIEQAWPTAAGTGSPKRSCGSSTAARRTRS